MSLSLEDYEMVVELSKEKPQFNFGARVYQVILLNMHCCLAIKGDKQLNQALSAIEPKQNGKMIIPLCTSFIEFADLLFKGNICFTLNPVHVRTKNFNADNLMRTSCLCKDHKCQQPHRLLRKMAESAQYWEEAMKIILERIRSQHASFQKETGMSSVEMPTLFNDPVLPIIGKKDSILEAMLPVDCQKPWISFNPIPPPRTKASAQNLSIVLNSLPAKSSGRMIMPYFTLSNLATPISLIVDIEETGHKFAYRIRSYDSNKTILTDEGMKDLDVFIFEYEIDRFEPFELPLETPKEICNISVQQEKISDSQTCYEYLTCVQFNLNNFKNSVYQVRNDTEEYCKAIVESFGGVWLDQFSKKSFVETSDEVLLKDRFFHAVFSSMGGVSSLFTRFKYAIDTFLDAASDKRLGIQYKKVSPAVVKEMAEYTIPTFDFDEHMAMVPIDSKVLNLSGLELYTASNLPSLITSEWKPICVPVFFKPSIFETGALFRKSIKLISSHFPIVQFEPWSWVGENFEMFYPNCLSRPFGLEWKTYLTSRTTTMVALVNIGELTITNLNILRQDCLKARIESKLIWTRNICHCPSDPSELLFNWAALLRWRFDLAAEALEHRQHELMFGCPFQSKKQLQNFTLNTEKDARWVYAFNCLMTNLTD